MHILKLALPLAGLPVAGQALAHKALQASAAVLPATRVPASRIDTDPTSLLGEVTGRGLHEPSAANGTKPLTRPAKSNVISARINRRH
jgi:hypothetical protein